MTDLTPDQRKALGARIDAARRSQGYTHSQLGHRTGYDERTIRNAINGRSTRDLTLSLICKALSIDMEGNLQEQSSALADEAHGGYAFSQYEDYIGQYFAYRRSFMQRGQITRFVVEIDWSSTKRCLIFSQVQKKGAETSKNAESVLAQGEIFIGPSTGLLHLSSSKDGSLSLMTLTKLRLEDKAMHGVLLTSAMQFYHKPAVSAVLLQKFDASADRDVVDPAKTIANADGDFRYFDEYLLDIEKNLGIFAIGTWGIERRVPRESA